MGGRFSIVAAGSGCFRIRNSASRLSKVGIGAKDTVFTQPSKLFAFFPLYLSTLYLSTLTYVHILPFPFYMRSYYVERSRKKYLNNSLYFVNLILISDFDGIFKNSELKIGEKLSTSRVLYIIPAI